MPKSHGHRTGLGWRTRPDPFAGVWEKDIEPLLYSVAGAALSATTMLEYLDDLYPADIDVPIRVDPDLSSYVLQ